MRKKSVPEWLNSSLWSSSSAPNDHRITRYATDARRPEPQPPPVREPIPEPPPPPYPEREGERKDPDSDSGSSAGEDPKPATRLSPDEASRQSQLIMEVSKKVINVGDLQRLVYQGVPDGTEIRSTIWKEG